MRVVQRKPDRGLPDTVSAAGGTGDGSTTRSGESYDAEIRAETDEALAQTGKDVGTRMSRVS